MNFFKAIANKASSVVKANKKGLIKTVVVGGATILGSPAAGAAAAATFEAASRKRPPAASSAAVAAPAQEFGVAANVAQLGNTSAALEARQAAGNAPVVAPRVLGLPKQTAIYAGIGLSLVVVVVMVMLVLRRRS